MRCTALLCHNAITRGSRDAVITVATQSRHGDDAVTTRFVVTTRSRQDHDAITTQSRQGHDRVTTRSRCGHDAFLWSRHVHGHDAVTMQSRRVLWSRRGYHRTTTGSTRSRSRCGMMRSRRVLWSRCGHDRENPEPVEPAASTDSPISFTKNHQTRALRYADFLSLGGQHGGSGGFLVLRMPALFLHDLETDG